MRAKRPSLSARTNTAKTLRPNMTIQFTKMHGLGNDFMVIDGVRQSIKLSPVQISAWSRRDTGIGFDQCLLIEPSQEAGIDFFYRIFNADGHEVGQCGNGARCLALFVQRAGLSTKKDLYVATNTTKMRLTIHANETVTVAFDKPRLEPKDIPLLVPNQKTWYSIQLSNQQFYDIHAINVGNPHAIVLVKNLSKIGVQSIGKEISEHALFPEQTNVEFMHIINSEQIELRVYERGTGETRACGSGAVAAVAVGRLFHQLAPAVTVKLPGGELLIKWPDLDQAILLTGSANFVYDGIVENCR